MTALLEARGLVKGYRTGRGREPRRAVDDVSFALDEGRTLALVGESGAGKSTTARLVLRLLEPDAGTVDFEGRRLTDLPRRDLRSLRQRMQMIFQDPYSSLDPRVRVLDSVGEPLVVHQGASKQERNRAALELLELVGLDRHQAARRPRELSGGQLQRVSIARALVTRPKLLVCDEPVAALDVSVQAQVINLLIDLQQELGLSYLFITHDLGIVRVIADEVAVMKDGAIVEHGEAEQLFAAPSHTYTRELLDAVVRLDLAGPPVS